MITSPHTKAIVKLIQQNSRRHNTWRVFSDFVEMGAISISNRVDFPQYDKREDRYMEIVKAYEKPEAIVMAEMMGELCMALETPHDALGQVFHELELHNKYTGQFFTPYTLCRMMAAITIGDDAHAAIASKGYITLSEPACGSGAMIIAAAEELKAQGIDYTKAMHVTAVDVDPKCVHMAYLQLSILGIPAVVIHGNTLSLEEWGVWATPAHIIDRWAFKMRDDRPVTIAEFPPVPVPPMGNDQLSLFGGIA